MKFWSTGNCSAFTSVSRKGMMHSQEMYDQLPIMPQSTCGAILKEIFFVCVCWGGGILGNSHTYFGGVFWEIHIHILGGYSGKFTYIFGGGVFWKPKPNPRIG